MTPLYDVPRRVTSSLASASEVTTLWRYTNLFIIIIIIIITNSAAVTVDEVAKLISSVPSKTFQLDPAPTWLVNVMSRLLSQHLRPSGDLRRWSDGLELAPGVYPGRAAQTVLGVYLKRTCSRVTCASSALAVLNYTNYI